jgi:transcriptional regulator with XRE-family HTH domain
MMQPLKLTVGRTGGVQNFNGDMLKFIREKNLWTQPELARKVRVTNYQVNRWERKKSYPTMRNLGKIASVFKVPVDYFFGNPPAGQEIRH